jgi:serine/threonine protein phosphatase PrpC
MPTELRTTSTGSLESERPRDDEIDLFGLTHIGKVRKNNQDHFLLATVHPQVVLHGTSLPEAEQMPMRGERVATLMLVADGVGGTSGGAEASQLAVEAIMNYVSHSLRCYHLAGGSHDGEFETALRNAAFEAHAKVRAEAASHPDTPKMATTLTIAIVTWPWVYVVQVGDSRCYRYVPGDMHQMTKDQTMAQALADQGALPREKVTMSPLNNVLVSAIGGDNAEPEVIRFDIRDRRSLLLLCTDGLTKHVSDAEIADHIDRMTSAEQLCRDLLALALERGGSDNVTILAGRAPRAANSEQRTAN